MNKQKKKGCALLEQAVEVSLETLPGFFSKSQAGRLGQAAGRGALFAVCPTRGRGESRCHGFAVMDEPKQGSSRSLQRSPRKKEHHRRQRVRRSVEPDKQTTYFSHITTKRKKSRPQLTFNKVFLSKFHTYSYFLLCVFQSSKSRLAKCATVIFFFYCVFLASVHSNKVLKMLLYQLWCCDVPVCLWAPSLPAALTLHVCFCSFCSQLFANTVLFTSVNLSGLFVRILTERAQRKAFLQARNCIEERLRMEDENEKQVQGAGEPLRAIAWFRPSSFSPLLPWNPC